MESFDAGVLETWRNTEFVILICETVTIIVVTVALVEN